MGKMFGIVVIVFGLWAAAEIHNEGAANAFGGILAGTGMIEEAKPGEEQRVGERVGTKVTQSHAEADARRNRLLTE